MFTVCTMQSTKRGEREGRHTCTRTGTALEAALLRGGRYASAQQRRVGYACCCKYSTASRSVALCVSTSACHARLCASSVGARAAAVRSRRRAAAAASLDASLDRASSLQTQRYENQQELRMGRCVCVCLSLSPSLSTSLSLSRPLSLSSIPCQPLSMHAPLALHLCKAHEVARVSCKHVVNSSHNVPTGRCDDSHWPHAVTQECRVEEQRQACRRWVCGDEKGEGKRVPFRVASGNGPHVAVLCARTAEGVQEHCIASMLLPH